MHRLMSQIASELPYGLFAREGRDGLVYLYDDSGQPSLPVASLAEATEAIERWLDVVEDDAERM